MSSIKNTYQGLVQQLLQRYEKREANNIVAIVFEDEFGVKNPLREDPLSAEQISRLKKIERELLQGQPMQYVLGMADFYGLRFKVNPDVLIPRPETEELVYLILENTKERKGEALSVLDIGTGSGCIPISLKKQRPAWQLNGLDISEGALTIARENARLNDCSVNFTTLNILKENQWPEGAFYDLIISNPPYIPPSEKKVMPAQVLEYEPPLALFVPEENPFLFYLKIVDFAVRHLSEQGLLFFECNEYNATLLLEEIQKRGNFRGSIYKDLNGKDRMLLLKR